MNSLHTRTRSTRIFIVAVVAMMLILPACGGTPAPMLAVINTPNATTPLKVNLAVTITGKASGNGMKSVDVYVDGAKLATIDAATNNEFDVSVPWTATKAGAHVIQLKGLNDKGEVIVSSEAMFVTVEGLPPTATPLPPAPTATSAAAPTAAPTEAAAQPTAAPSGPTASVKEGDFVNVRKGPAVPYDKLGTLDKGLSAPIKGKNADSTWWQISFPAAADGVGWVYGQLISITGDTAGVPVAQAPALPTGAAPPPAAATAVPPTAAATSSVPPSALLPYTQVMRFSPRDDIGDVPLGHNGQSKTADMVWEVNGAKSLELEITAAAGTGIFANCPTGNLSSISPNDAVGKRKPLAVPSGTYQFTITGKGYYIFTIHVVKADGSQTTIPRAVIVDCYKTQ
jgi:uncharacterized protein YraI